MQKNPTSDPCATVIDDLSVYLLGDLSDDRAAAVRAHLAECASCAAAADREAEILGAIKQSGAPFRREDGEAAEAKDRALSAALTELTGGSKRKPSGRRRRIAARWHPRPQTWGVAAAAVALVGVGLAIAMLGGGSPSGRPRTVAGSRAPSRRVSPARVNTEPLAWEADDAAAETTRERPTALEPAATDAADDDRTLVDATPVEIDREPAMPPVLLPVAPPAPARVRVAEDAAREYETDSAALLKRIVGRVRLARAGSDTWGTAREGLWLQYGDRLHSADGLAMVELTGGGTVAVNTYTRADIVRVERAAPAIGLEQGEVLVTSAGRTVSVFTRDGLAQPVGTLFDVKVTSAFTRVIVKEGVVAARSRTGTRPRVLGYPAAEALVAASVDVGADRRCYVRCGKRPEKPTAIDAAPHIAWADRLTPDVRLAETFDRGGMAKHMGISPSVFDVTFVNGQLHVNMRAGTRGTGGWFHGMPFYTRASFELAKGVHVACDIDGNVRGSTQTLAALCLYETMDREKEPRPKILLRLDVGQGTGRIVQGTTHDHDVSLGAIPRRAHGAPLDRCEIYANDREFVMVLNGARFGPHQWAIAVPERVRTGAEANVVEGYTGPPVVFDNFGMRAGVKVLK